MSAWLGVLVLAGGQHHGTHMMPGMTMPMPPAKPDARPAPRPAAGPVAKPASRRAKPRLQAQATPAPAADHATMDHGAMDHATMDHGAAPAIPTQGAAMGEKLGTDLPPGDAPAPPPPLPHYADRIWDPAAMARGRSIMMGQDGGGQRFAQVMVNMAEYGIRNGRDGYRWDGEAWFGGDIDRLVVKSEGEGDIGGNLQAAEVRALYSHAIGPYFNLQAGVRQDIRPTPARTFATIGIAGLAPYWFEVEAAAFVSTRGEVLGRVEAYYDQRLTQRLILQPRAEVNLSAGGTRRIGQGAGVTTAELGLRLRYEVRREFAPYVGVSWERALGGTARTVRAAGDDPGGAALVLGIRTWF